MNFAICEILRSAPLAARPDRERGGVVERKEGTETPDVGLLQSALDLLVDLGCDGVGAGERFQDVARQLKANDFGVVEAREQHVGGFDVGGFSQERPLLAVGPAAQELGEGLQFAALLFGLRHRLVLTPRVLRLLLLRAMTLLAWADATTQAVKSRACFFRDAGGESDCIFRA